MVCIYGCFYILFIFCPSFCHHLLVPTGNPKCYHTNDLKVTGESSALILSESALMLAALWRLLLNVGFQQTACSKSILLSHRGHKIQFSEKCLYVLSSWDLMAHDLVTPMLTVAKNTLNSSWKLLGWCALPSVFEGILKLWPYVTSCTFKSGFFLIKLLWHYIKWLSGSRQH